MWFPARRRLRRTGLVPRTFRDSNVTRRQTDRDERDRRRTSCRETITTISLRRVSWRAIRRARGPGCSGPTRRGRTGAASQTRRGLQPSVRQRPVLDPRDGLTARPLHPPPMMIRQLLVGRPQALVDRMGHHRPVFHTGRPDHGCGPTAWGLSRANLGPAPHPERSAARECVQRSPVTLDGAARGRPCGRAR